MAEQLRVMISSTARDLPEHRDKVMHACLRLGLFPEMMEHLPASDSDAIAKSVEMVDRANVYLVILGYRYGYVPSDGNPEAISMTEIEYDRAVERGIPRLVFFMDRLHAITAADMDEDTTDPVEVARRKIKLDELKKRAGKERVADSFKSAEELRGNAIHALTEFRQPDLTAFHYISDIPAPPEVYIAHPYTLLQTGTLIGRQKELKLLTDWITGKQLEFDGQKAPADSVRIMSVVAIGGMGKSALTWKWFNDIAPQEMKNLAGRMWWSFYESDATFENFVTRALAYVSKHPLDEVQQIPAPERETQLLAALDHQPFLLVLDGLERILIAYARMDAARLDDSEVGKEKSLRKTTDPKVGGFLKKLAQAKQSRVLVSSRLYPAELETSGGDPIPGSFRINIAGLIDEDAVELWRAFEVSGSRDELLPVFSTFAKHPLLIQALAGEVKRYRKAPANFEAWRKANPRFDPSKFPELQDAMAHVLEYALRGLEEQGQTVLQTIAAFRMPTNYDTLAAVLIGENKPCTNESELDAVLNELEDRGLLGWDKRANRYDLHPLVRGVVWNGLGDETRRGVYTNLHTHFEALPMIDDYRKIKTLDDLTPAIELYNTLIGLARYDNAAEVFRDRLSNATLYRLSTSRVRVELLELLFPGGMEHLPRLNNEGAQAYILNALAAGYRSTGRLQRASMFYRRSNTVNSKDGLGLQISLSNIGDTLRLSGSLCESETVGRTAFMMARKSDSRQIEAIVLHVLGLTLEARGVTNGLGLSRALRLFRSLASLQGEGLVSSFLAQRALWLGDFASALGFAKRAWDLAYVENGERDFIMAARAQGEAFLALDELVQADEWLHHAVTRARNVAFVEEELPALVALAELRRRQRDAKAARELLDDVWESAERGPYPLFHADAFNVVAQIERDEDNTKAAIEAATKAYRLAWCDGPPFAYHWGLEKAKQHLKELGAPEPEMPPFDDSKFEPMPEVEINPHDEFYVDEGLIDSN